MKDLIGPAVRDVVATAGRTKKPSLQMKPKLKLSTI